MANIEEDLKKVVNVKKVVKAVKNIGYFALYRSSEDSTLLITRSFILNLNAEQAWEVQCALLVKELGKWYTVVKGEPFEEKPVERGEVDMYYHVVNDANLNIIGFTELYLNNDALYAGNGGYIGIKGSYVDMLGGRSVMRKSVNSDFVVASEFHIITPAEDPESEYLVPLLF